MRSLNERAWERLEAAIAEQDRLNISQKKMECGARLVDAGVNAPGGLEVGLVMAEVGMAGLGEARVEMAPLLGALWPWVVARSDHPLEACFLSQAAHWPVQVGGFRAMGSGPACLLNRELAPGRAFDFEERCDHAVLVLETRQLPDEAACLSLAAACGVEAEHLALFVAPTSSLAGSAQIAARSLETGLHKLHHLGFDLHRVVSGMGRCPIATPTGNDLISLGKTNDMVIFASSIWLAIKGATDQELSILVETLPSATSPNYGEPFLQTLKKAGGFYNTDPGLFAPAEATLFNVDSGKVFHAGQIDQARLAKVIKESDIE
jgi:methenyltetrahydromethanopterin cyclohydrolase